MKYNWNKENLEKTVKDCNCWLGWLRSLNIPTCGCNYRTLKKKAILYNIDTSHFNSIYARTHNGQRAAKNRTDSQIFSDSIKVHRSTLKKEYINRILNGIAKCECCGIESWNNKELVFQMHHKDGNNKNNKLDNLILLCPNCHSQTENFSNRKRYKLPSSISV